MQDKNTSEKLEFFLEIIKYLCKQYPIVIPYIMSLKIPTLRIKEVTKN